MKRRQQRKRMHISGVSKLFTPNKKKIFGPSETGCRTKTYKFFGKERKQKLTCVKSSSPTVPNGTIVAPNLAAVLTNSC
jgi:hypothetical protein